MNKKIVILGLVVLVSLLMFSVVSVEAVPTVTNTSAVFKVIGSPAAASHGAGATFGRSRANQTQQVNIKINFTQDAGAISNKTARVRMAIIGSNGAVVVNKTGNLTYQNSTLLRLRNRTAAGGAPPIWEINYTFNLTGVAPGNFTVVFNGSNSVGNSVKRKWNFTLKDVTKPSITSLIEVPLNGTNAGSIVEIRVKAEDVKGGNVSVVYVNLTVGGVPTSPKKINLSTNDNRKNGTWAANFTLILNETRPVLFTIYANDSRGNLGYYGNFTYRNNINGSRTFMFQAAGQGGLTSGGSGGGGGGGPGRISRFDPRYLSAYTIHCVQGDCAGYSYVEDSSPAVVVEDVEIRPVVTPKPVPTPSVEDDKEGTGDMDELAGKDLATGTGEVKSDNTTLWVVIIIIIVLGLLAWWWFKKKK